MKTKDLKKYIYENNKIIDILEALGMNNINDNNSKYISCSQPDGDNPSSTIIYKDEYLTTLAYTRNIKPKDYVGQTNIFHLIMFILKCEFTTAITWCCEILGLDNVKTISNKRNKNYLALFKGIKRPKQLKEQIYYSADILNQYSDIPHIDLIRNDAIISERILKKYNIRYDFRSERIVFPHFKYDDSTKIAGLVGRTTIKAYKELGIKKYMSLLPTEYIKTQNLYAFNLNKQYILKNGIVIVVESEKSVMKLDMYGFPYAVSVGCHNISDFQKKLLISLRCEVVIAFDKDVEEENILETCKQFSKYTKVSYIKDEYNLLKEKDSPVDRGYKKWCILFKYRRKFEEVYKNDK